MAINKKIANLNRRKDIEDIFKIQHPALEQVLKNNQDIEVLLDNMTQRVLNMTQLYLKAHDKVLNHNLSLVKGESLESQLLRLKLSQKAANENIQSIRNVVGWVQASMEADSPFSYSTLRKTMAPILKGAVARRLAPELAEQETLLQEVSRKVEMHTLDEEIKDMSASLRIEDYIWDKPMDNLIFKKRIRLKGRKIKKIIEEILLTKVNSGLAAYEQLKIVTNDEAVMRL